VNNDLSLISKPFWIKLIGNKYKNSALIKWNKTIKKRIEINYFLFSYLFNFISSYFQIELERIIRVSFSSIQLISFLYFIWKDLK
jgi:hypothetical protein